MDEEELLFVLDKKLMMSTGRTQRALWEHLFHALETLEMLELKVMWKKMLNNDV